LRVSGIRVDHDEGVGAIVGGDRLESGGVDSHSWFLCDDCAESATTILHWQRHTVHAEQLGFRDDKWAAIVLISHGKCSIIWGFGKAKVWRRNAERRADAQEKQSQGREGVHVDNAEARLQLIQTERSPVKDSPAGAGIMYIPSSIGAGIGRGLRSSIAVNTRDQVRPMTSSIATSIGGGGVLTVSSMLQSHLGRVDAETTCCPL
jgi:hypothetical protein